MTTPSPTADGEALGRMMRDLVALSALPNVWHRSEPLEVARSLAAVLEKALPLAVVGVLLETADRGEDSLVVRSGGRLLQWTDAAAVVQILEPAFGLAERAPEKPRERSHLTS